MSYVIAAPEMMATAATDLAGISATLSAAHLSAAVSTTALPPAAADEVSAAIAQLFSTHGAGFHALGAQFSTAAAQFTSTLKSSAAAYSSAETHSAATLTPGQLDWNALIMSLQVDVQNLFRSLPPQLQNALDTLVGLIIGPPLLGIFLGALLIAEIGVLIQGLLAGIGL